MSVYLSCTEMKNNNYMQINLKTSLVEKQRKTNITYALLRASFWIS